jgi:hypothetical protein
MEILLTSGPIALSRNPNDITDVGYDFSDGSISGLNGSYMVAGIDPSTPPDVAECQDAVEHNEHYSGLGGWNLRGYFCMITSRNDLVLVLPTASTNGINFQVWMMY